MAQIQTIQMTQPGYPQYTTDGAPPAYSYAPMIQPAVPAGQVIFIQQPSPSSGPVHRYAANTSIAFGIIQVIIGVLSMLFQIINLATGQGGTYINSGIWCGVFFIIAGALGIGAGKSKSKCLIVGHLVMCVIAASLSAQMLSISIQDALTLGYHYWHRDTKLGVALFAIMAVMAIIEGVIAIIASCLSCCVVCTCCSNSQHQGVVLPHMVQYVNTQPPGQATVVQYSTASGSVQQSGQMAQPMPANYPAVSTAMPYDQQKY